jgi:chemotaxis protein MotB
MAGNEEKPIIVKKVIVAGGGHHGGAWKVAYADFVTAMMAFFLLLWLLNVTTDEQRSGIADYFAPTAASQRMSGAGGVMGGRTLSPDGARTSEMSQMAVVVELSPQPTGEPSDAQNDKEEQGGGKDKELSEQELMRQLAEREQKELAEAEQMLRQAIQEVPELNEMSKNLIIDNTPEGLRIQLVDQERQSMFPSGNADMMEHTRKLLEKVAEVIQRVPNQVAITGHTDATPFRTRNGYGNWELSADRANASRRTLVDMGIDPQRIANVTGKASNDPLIPENPTHPSNRRISIVLLRENPLFGTPAPARQADASPVPSNVGPAPGVGPAPVRN